MIKVRFSLNADSRVPGEYYVIASATHNHGRWVRSTGVKIKKKKDWNIKTKRVLAHVDDATYINTVLDKIELAVKNALMQNENANNLDIDRAVQGRQIDNTMSFLEYCRWFYEERKGSGRFDQGTVKVYKVFINLIVEYQSLIGVTLQFSELNRKLLSDFQTFLTKDKKHSHNTISRTFKTLSTIINEAKKHDFKVRDDYKDFSIPEKLTPKIYLNLDELTLLNDTKYPDNIRHAVDIFLICAYTGLRIGNFKYLKADSIQTIRGADMIVYHQIKGDEQHIIPMHHIVRDIVARYDGWPPMITEQTINEKIKIAARMAGIDKPVTMVNDIGGRKVVKTVPKYSLITNHTARRSCATNMHILGVDHALIKKMTGHKTEKNLLKYIRIDNEDSALLLAQSAFFK